MPGGDESHPMMVAQCNACFPNIAQPLLAIAVRQRSSSFSPAWEWWQAAHSNRGLWRYIYEGVGSLFAAEQLLSRGHFERRHRMPGCRRVCLRAVREPVPAPCSLVPMIIPGIVAAKTVGELAGSLEAAVAVGTTEANPKSRTFTTPSGVIFTFAGFRSRWMTPFSCAASKASAICRATGSASFNGITAVDPIGKRWPVDILHDEVIGADVVECADMGMVKRRHGACLALKPFAELLSNFRLQRSGRGVSRTPC